MPVFIKYCMGCIPTLHNKILLGYEPPSIAGNDRNIENYIKTIKAENPREVYILCDIPLNISELATAMIKKDLKDFILRASSVVPTTKFLVIKINNKINSREYKLAKSYRRTKCRYKNIQVI